ncbi:MAG: PspC domain-containing protein [bacterium]|nr:PspC domain-containing protein [bacterium]
MPEALATKQCPYCAEEIRIEAVKCRWCGSYLGGGPLQRSWYRSREHRRIAGVCAGLADEFGISVTLVRLAFVLGTLVGGGMGLILYAVLWVAMPYRPALLPDARPTPARLRAP